MAFREDVIQVVNLPSKRIPSKIKRFFSGRNLLILYALVPMIIYMSIMWIIPLAYGGVMSLFEWNPLSLKTTTFIGLENFHRAFTEPIVGKAITNSLRYAIFVVGLGTTLSFLLAMMLNSLTRGRAVFRLIFFLPVVTSLVATSIIWKALYEPRNGIFNTVLAMLREGLGLNFKLPLYLLDPRIALYAIGIMIIWKTVGYTSVLFLAGLQNIPHELYEAARIDGAGRWNLMRFITVPLLQPIFVFVLVTDLAGTIQAFTEIAIMQGSAGSGSATMGGPANSTLTIIVELYQRAFRAHEFGYASSLAVIVFILITTISLFQLRLGRTRWEY